MPNCVRMNLSCPPQMPPLSVWRKKPDTMKSRATDIYTHTHNFWDCERLENYWPSRWRKKQRAPKPWPRLPNAKVTPQLRQRLPLELWSVSVWEPALQHLTMPASGKSRKVIEQL